MAGPDLSHRLGVALGTRTVSPEERQLVFDAALKAESWDDLPSRVQALVEEIEARPGWVAGEKSTRSRPVVELPDLPF